MYKNTASQTWTVFAFDSTDGSRKTGDSANITAKIAIDDGVATASNDTNPTEVEDGKYRFTLTQAETNGDKLEMFAESSTADILVIGLPEVIYTRPANFTDLTVAAIWANATRTLTQSAASVTAAVSGSNVETYRHDNWSVSLTGLGDISARTNLYVTIKTPATDDDADAMVQWDESTGLLIVNGAAATAGDGSITVDDEAAGNITIALAASAAADTAGGKYLYDVKEIIAGPDANLVAGPANWTIHETPTHATT